MYIYAHQIIVFNKVRVEDYYNECTEVHNPQVAMCTLQPVTALCCTTDNWPPSGSIINPRCACAGGLRYLSCLFVCLSVCLSVCYHLIADIVRFYGLPKVCTVLF